MTEPLFTVPLSALVYFSPVVTAWRCNLDDYGNASCCDEHAAESHDEAVAAAIEHLGSVHGIREAEEPTFEDRLRDANKVVAEHMKALAAPGSASATKWAEAVEAALNTEVVVTSAVYDPENNRIALTVAPVEDGETP